MTKRGEKFCCIAPDFKKGMRVAAIDAQLYELHGLTVEENGIVEVTGK